MGRWAGQPLVALRVGASVPPAASFLSPSTWHPVMVPLLGCELLWVLGGVTTQPQLCLLVSCAVYVSPRNAQEGSWLLSGRDWD